MQELPPSFTDISVIRENQRFGTYKAIYEDQPVFVKRVNHEDLIGGIQREINGLKAFSEIAQTHDIGFIIPRLVTAGQNYVATSWEEGAALTIDENGFKDDQVEFLAASLASLDQFATSTNKPAIFNVDTNSAAESVAVLHERHNQAALSDFVDSGLIEKGFGYLGKNIATLDSRLAHADINPSNILEKDGIYTLVDYEFTSAAWPRFYDFVNLVSSRLILFPALTEDIHKLAERFYMLDENLDLGTHKTQLNTIAMYRALSLMWELGTEPNQFHNTKQTMTAETYQRIKTVMAAVLKDELFTDAQLP